jgi:hypothetical protein
MGGEDDLFAAGVSLQELKTIDLEMPEHLGCILTGYNDAGDVVGEAYVRTGLTQEDRDFFAEAALERFLRFLEHGPNLDAWQERSDGDWQLWLRPVQLDPWLTDG